MATSMMQSARTKGAAAKTGPSFTPKDPREFTPPEQHDAVDRIVAAGLKIMYSPEMQQERQQAIDSQDPVSKKLAENVTGLMLTLDQRSQGGLPPPALFPVAVMLDNEAANMLVHAGQKVTQDDYNESLQILYVQIGKKLGASDDQLMQHAQGALQGGGAAPPDAAPPTDPNADPNAPPVDAMAPSPGALPPQGA